MSTTSVVSATRTSPRRWTRAAWPGWIPLAVLPAATILFRSRLEPWCFMWVLAFSIFWGCNWRTWWTASLKMDLAGTRRSLAYLFAWPGMDADAFLNTERCASCPRRSEWMWGGTKTVFGAVLVWVVVRFVPAEFMAGRMMITRRKQVIAARLRDVSCSMRELAA